MSYRHLHTTPLNASLSALLKRGAHLGVGLGAMAPMLALANPSGGNVAAGQATITSPGANGLVVKQTSASAIINWQQFNIGKGQYVQFIQPNSSSVVLNRVVGGSASSIFGSLTGNGQIFLVNPNGVFFGRSATLDVQGFLASTLDISDSNFLAGHYVFDQQGAAGAEIINQGKLRSHNGGYIILAGDYAENDGLITAQSGHVILASGAKTTLNLNGNQLVNFAVNTATLASFAGVENTGKLISDGGTVIMTADVANLLKSTVVNNSGLIEAHAISKSGGTISLTATGGDIENSGTLDANATKVGQQGGTITLKGDEKTILSPTSNITALGDGARGGKLEVSGNFIAIRGVQRLGKGGQFLLDPEEVELTSGATGTGSNLSQGTVTTTPSVSKLNVSLIQTMLNSGAAVNISAAVNIFHSSAVHAITATGPGAGTLKFKVGSGGGVELDGVDITIKGNLHASMGYGSFGRIQAGDVFLKAQTAVTLEDATENSLGVVTNFSAVANNGNLAIQAATIEASGTGVLALKNTTVGDGINLTGSIGKTSAHVAGDVILKAARYNSPNLKIFTNGKVSITASNGYANLNSMVAGKSVDITVHGNNSGGVNIGGKIKAGAGVTILQSHGSIVDTHTISASNGYAIGITNSNGKTSLGTLNGSGAVTITEKGHGQAVTIAGPVHGGGLIKLTQSSGGISAHAMSAEGAGISIKNSKGATTLHQLTAGGAITITDNSVGGSGALDLAGAVKAHGNITIKQVHGELLTAGISASNGSLKVTDSNGYAVLGSLTAKTTLTVTENGHGSSVQLKGPVKAGGAINITQIKGGIEAGAISASNGGAINITNSDGRTSLGALTAGGAITITEKGGAVGSGFGLFINGNAQAHGNVTITQSHGGIQDNHAISASNGGNINVTNSNGYANLGALTAGGTITVTDKGHGNGLRIAGAVKANGNVTISQSHGFISAHAISASSGNINITNSNGYAGMDALMAAGTITVTEKGHGNSVEINGTVHAGGAINVTQSSGAINARGFSASNAASISITDTKGSILTGFVKTGGKVTINAGAHSYTVRGGSNGVVSGSKGVTITAKQILDSGSAEAGMQILAKAAGGAITVKGQFGDSAGEGLGHALSISAAKKITLNHKTVKAASLRLAGSAAVFSGTGNSIKLSASHGNLSMDAPIGTALAPVKLNVVLNDTGGGIFIQKSIYTGTTAGIAKAKADISASQTFVAPSIGGLSLQGVLVGSNGGKAVTLSTKGSVNLAGANVAIGSVFVGSSHAPTGHTNIGAVSVISGKDINLHAIGSGSHVGRVAIVGGVISGASANSDRSVLLQAANDINVLGHHIDIRGGVAFGSTGATHKTVTVTANTTLKAGHDVNIEAGASGSVFLAGGSAGAFVGAGSKAKGTYTATADAELNITAGKSLNIGGGKVDVSVGSGDVVASAGKGVIANANTNVSVNLKGNAVSFSGGTIAVGGHDKGSVHGTASGSLAKANATVHADINITATTSLSFSGKSVSLEGGQSVGRDGRGFASGHSAVATLTATGGLNLTAGAAGVTLTATSGDIHVQGGAKAAESMSVSAAGHGKATATVGAGVKIATPGSISVSAAGNALFSGGLTDGVSANVTAIGGKSALTVNSGLSVTAVGLSISANKNVGFIGGSGVGANDQVTARQAGSAAVHDTAGVNINLTGAFNVAAGSSVRIKGADGVASSAFAFASHAGDKAALTADGSVHIKAKSVQASGSGLQVQGGGGAAAFAIVRDNGGAATLTADASVGITAVKGITFGVNGSSSTMIIEGGNAAALAAHVQTGHLGKAQLTAQSGVNLTTTGSGAAIKLTTNGHSGGIVLKGGVGLAATSSSVGASVSAGIGGGLAAITAAGSVNVSAKGALTIQAGDKTHTGALLIAGGGSEGYGAVVFATKSGKATVGATADVNLSGTAVTLAAGGSSASGSMLITAGGNKDGDGASVVGRFGGVATDTIESAVKITAGGAFTATAGNAVRISGSGSVGDHALVLGSHSGAQAALSLTDTVSIKAGSVSVEADDGFIELVGVSGIEGLGQVIAVAKGDKATLTGAGGIAITATTGAISFTASGAATPSNTSAGDLSILAGNGNGFDDTVIAVGPLAATKVNIDTSVTLTAKQGFIANASQDFILSAGGAIGVNQNAAAFGKGAIATVSETANVKITAASVSIKATGNAIVTAGDGVGAGISASASNSAHVNLTLGAGVSIKAPGKVSISASHNLLVGSGGSGNGSFSANAIRHGVANVSVSRAIAIQAGGALSFDAGSSLLIAGEGGMGAMLNAVSNGSVNAKLDGSLTLKAGTTLKVTAGGFLQVQGGDRNFIGVNVFPSFAHSKSSSIGSTGRPGGKATGALTAAVSLTAGGDINLGGGSGLLVRAGDGQQLFVGAARLPFGFFGDDWAGGTATLTGNAGVTVKAGHNLNLNGGTGSIAVQGMYGARGSSFSSSNNANVRGGSINAVAKLTLLGNTVLTAVNNITLTAAGILSTSGAQVAGNVNIIGGSMANLRADHAQGNVTILGSADATLHAGNDVLIKGIGGSLTVAGVNVNASHNGEVLADAHADQGVDNVTGHADATLSAGHNISMASGASLGGAFNVVAGEFVFAVAKGVSSTEKATATANATVSAGNSITVKGAGDLNLLGGLFDSAAALAQTFTSGSTFDSAVKAHSATMQAKTTVSAGLGTVSLTLKGDGVIAGGDSLKAQTLLSFQSGGFGAVGLASGDASTTIKGANVSITVGGNLLLRGGSGELAEAAASGGGIKATATANAGANIKAIGNVTLNVGTGTTGTASIVGGSAGNADAFSFRSDNVATATAHGDVTVTAGAALKLTVAGPLKVAGGPGAAALDNVLAGGSSSFFSNVFGTSGSAPAFKGTATGTLTSKVLMTAGTTLTVNAGKAITILGGSHVGSFAAVDAAAGSSHAVGSDKATLTVDASVAMKAVGKITVAAASGGVNVTTTIQGSSGFPFATSQGVNNVSTIKLKESVTLTGGTVSVGGGHPNTNSAGAPPSSGGVSIDARIRIGKNLTLAAQPLSLPPVSGSRRVEGGVQMAPSVGATSFGFARPLVPGTSPLISLPSSVAPDTAGVLLTSEPLSLDLLQSTSLVTNLVPVLAPPAESPPAVTLYDPRVSSGMPEPDSGAVCRSLLQRSDGQYRCDGGSK